MKPADFWKNFNLGEELSLSGTFIYNGMRGFHEMRNLHNGDEAFLVLYNLSVGFERLLKIVVVLLEHNENVDQEELEKSLITHNHLELLNRIEKHAEVKLSEPHKGLFDLLGKFYKSTRYSRFTLSSVYRRDEELKRIREYLEKHLKTEVKPIEDFLAIENTDHYKRFIRRTVLKISSSLFNIVKDKSSSLGLYTYELRYGSKAQIVFRGEYNPSDEDILWKELLIFLMNTEESSSYLEFLRGIPALDFDPEEIKEFLDCFQSDSEKARVMGHLDHLYMELNSKDRGERLKLMKVIGSSNVFFDGPEDEIDEEDKNADEM